ncbi:MAG: hypothetical protein ABI824_04330 [Acidobacteriota bacterium]
MVRCLLAMGLLSSSLTFGQTNVLTLGKIPTVKAKLGSTVTVKVPLQVRLGYHVNSNTPSDKYLVPLKVTWEKGMLASTDVIFPKPSLETYKFQATPLSVFSGTFEITTKFKVAPTAPVGPMAMSGTVSYQACNDRECLQPAKLPVTLQVDIVR